MHPEFRARPLKWPRRCPAVRLPTPAGRARAPGTGAPSPLLPSAAPAGHICRLWGGAGAARMVDLWDAAQPASSQHAAASAGSRCERWLEQRVLHKQACCLASARRPGRRKPRRWPGAGCCCPQSGTRARAGACTSGAEGATRMLKPHTRAESSSRAMRRAPMHACEPARRAPPADRPLQLVGQLYPVRVHVRKQRLGAQHLANDSQLILRAVPVEEVAG